MRYYLIDEKQIKNLNIHPDTIKSQEAINHIAISDMVHSLGDELCEYLEKVKQSDDLKVATNMFYIRDQFLQVLGKMYKDFKFNTVDFDSDYEPSYKLTESQLNQLGVSSEVCSTLQDYLIPDIYPTRADIDSYGFERGTDLGFEDLLDVLGENSELREEFTNKIKELVLSIAENNE